MSLWFDHLRIGICADRLVWVRFARGLRRRVVEKQEIRVTADVSGAAWAPALATLKARLGDSVSGRTEYSVVLANRFVRYVIVPWHPALMRHAERLAHARHCFKETYGEIASGWDVTISGAGYGEPVLASAIDQLFLAGLRDAFEGKRLRSVQPYLTAAYGQFRKTLAKSGAGPAYFGVVDADDLSLLRLVNGSVKSVFNQRISSDWRVAMPGLLLQAAEDGEADRSVSVLAPGRAATESLGDTRIHRLVPPALPGYSPLSDPELAMGVVGI